MTADGPRILILSSFPTEPRSGGARMRTGAFLDAAARLGRVDLFVWVRDRPGELDRRHGPVPGAERVLLSPRTSLRSGFFPRLEWLTTSREPLEVDLRPSRRARREFTSFAAHRYDLTLVLGFASWAPFADLIREPLVLDLNDIEHTKAQSRADALGHGLADRVRRFQQELNVSRWRDFEQRAARRAAMVAVCSDLDLDRLGSPDGGVVIPNGYTAPEQPAGRRPERGDRAERVRRRETPPTVTFVGAMTYPPNTDGAHRLVRHIAPHLWAARPDLQVRLVGSAAPSVNALADTPRVTVTGFVDDLDEELIRADVLVVPIRVGGGTRIKVVEAFAQEIPLVSTALGAEGIDAVHREHLLIADEPATFAAAVLELLDDPALARRLTDSAAGLFAKRYRWDSITDDLTGRLSALLAEGETKQGHG